VEFTFDSLWNGLITTAMFSTDKSRVYYIVIEDDKTVVPHEVLANEGIMHFGVFGYNTDPKQTRTTEVRHLTVAEGAITDTTAIHIDPTPDVYQQLLIMAAETRAIAESIEADVEAGIYTPKKGVDYWTAEDKAEMVNDVLAEFIDASEVAL
jgi:hypothetical protein